MKRLLLVSVLAMILSTSNAQTWDEWFNQKATQKKYLVQQVAALQIYIGYLQKGYRIAKNGLNTISSIKNGHYSLDKIFFNSLTSVNPVVSKNPSVKAIVAMQESALRCLDSIQQLLGSDKLLSPENKSSSIATQNIFTQLVADRKMLLTITSVDLAMSDDERLKKLEELKQRTTLVLNAAVQLRNDLYVLIIQKEHESNDNDVLKHLYKIK